MIKGPTNKHFLKFASFELFFELKKYLFSVGNLYFSILPNKNCQKSSWFCSFLRGGGEMLGSSWEGGGGTVTTLKGYNGFKFQNGGRFAVRIRCYHFGNRFEYLFILYLNNVIQKLININFSDIILNGIYSTYCS